MISLFNGQRICLFISHLLQDIGCVVWKSPHETLTGTFCWWKLNWLFFGISVHARTVKLDNCYCQTVISLFYGKAYCYLFRWYFCSSLFDWSLFFPKDGNWKMVGVYYLINYYYLKTRGRGRCPRSTAVILTRFVNPDLNHILYYLCLNRHRAGPNVRVGGSAYREFWVAEKWQRKFGTQNKIIFDCNYGRLYLKFCLVFLWSTNKYQWFDLPSLIGPPKASKSICIPVQPSSVSVLCSFYRTELILATQAVLSPALSCSTPVSVSWKQSVKSGSSVLSLVEDTQGTIVIVKNFVTVEQKPRNHEI